MSRTIVICGHGTGISHAVAQRFGKEGFQVALVARSADKLEAGAKSLSDAGVTAKAFPCDLGDANAVAQMIADVRAQLGPITVLHWNAYAPGAGDLTDGELDALRHTLEVSAVSLVGAVHAALPDLRSQSEAAVLVTGGGIATYDPKVDAMVVGWKAMGLAVGKAAQHKVVGLLHARLASENIYVADVTVLGIVKGTAWDQGNATLAASDIAERFWQVYRERREVNVTVAG
ncbi:MAG: SDR family NAD(P)-dependent oxidoreductase [Deltaproteobacteria bacterium]|nr:SDR family NAD(P)-dependent oxidoreductase [Nannocystaceae bacterium]